jgi:hypothetical protein
MSDNDIKIVEQTLKGLMIPDNNLRREAEIALEELMKNRAGLIFCLSNLLLGNIIVLMNSLPRIKCQIIRCCSYQKNFRNQRR